jgi:tRNA threonylcarbamoyladenosine biosynthesis protein TsaE
MTRTYRCDSPAETEQLGIALGRKLFPGAVIALVGPLGAGKTFFSRGIALGLAVIDVTQVTSPTFVLVQEYEARLPIYHFDAYRLKAQRDFEDLGALEYFAGEGVCLVEWADRVSDVLPQEHLRVELCPTGQSSRDITLTAIGCRYERLLLELTMT